MHLVFAKYCINNTAAQADSEFSLNGKISESISNNLTMRLYSNKVDQMKKFRAAQQDEINNAQKARRSLELPKFIQSVIAILFMASMMLMLIRVSTNVSL